MLDKSLGGISMLDVDAQIDAIQAKRFLKLIISVQNRQDDQRHKYFILPFQWISAMNIADWECGFSRQKSVSNLTRSEFTAFWLGVARCWKKLNPILDEDTGDILWGDRMELSKYKTKMAAHFLHSIKHDMDKVISCEKWNLMWQLDVPNIELNCSQVWIHLKYAPITNKQKETLWLILHNALTSGELIQRRWSQYFTPVNFNCKMCHQLESIEHIFLQCPMVIPVIDWFKQFINNIIQHNLTIPSFSILSGFLPSSQIINNNKQFFSYTFKILQSTLISEIWKARCRSIFDNIDFSSIAVINSIKSSICKRVQEDWLQFRRKHPVNNNEFSRTWCLNNVICFVTNNSLNLTNM
jgi:hypothetical protein